MRFKICHDKNVRYDIVSNQGVHSCSVCKRRFLCVLPENHFGPVTWKEIFSWTRFWQGGTA